MKGIQNKKFISWELSYIYPVYVIRKENSVFFHAWPMRMCQLVTFGELSNDVDTTGTGSVRVVASRVANLLRLPASF
jgi:hypothetical protein